MNNNIRNVPIYRKVLLLFTIIFILYVCNIMHITALFYEKYLSQAFQRKENYKRDKNLVFIQRLYNVFCSLNI